MPTHKKFLVILAAAKHAHLQGKRLLFLKKDTGKSRTVMGKSAKGLAFPSNSFVLITFIRLSMKMKRNWYCWTGIPINEYSKLPDVVLYDKKEKWLFLVEAVTSHGPVSPKNPLPTSPLASPDYRSYSSGLVSQLLRTSEATSPDYLIH